MVVALVERGMYDAVLTWQMVTLAIAQRRVAIWKMSTSAPRICNHPILVGFSNQQSFFVEQLKMVALVLKVSKSV
jgi:hypothetical protein